MNKKTDWTKIPLSQCNYCGGQIKPRKNEKLSAYKKRKFCSNFCKLKNLAKVNSGKPAHNNKRVERVCIYCNKKQMVSPSFADRKFCSQKCMGMWMKENSLGEKSNH